ncbi:hypothetical protein [Saccharothrix xinjiangensis]|uniref:Uncharacterized protein n=1 Tax=Saccharothrix xinjiangensis TaxID=204798 RepID=A0ABV9XY18_9PSEU
MTRPNACEASSAPCSDASTQPAAAATRTTTLARLSTTSRTTMPAFFLGAACRRGSNAPGRDEWLTCATTELLSGNGNGAAAG